ncbi:SEC-C motif-containing protein [Clostridium sp. A1-XYC3]|uniref:SEC-C motif-containing protein n=1 Tax=Clostridium tanneri TaxID=3037988 RepID=A0ABU4JVG8_9CLOT|nr:SEC-C motif-containing protein [Clostridium sp. A1-XYC3]MDW8801951.1 SEC-C motif-containing protein [Clostridium sp. A1-XYC3]
MEGKLYTKEKRIKISPENHCFCGSGLKFKNCCMKNNSEYKTLGRNYRDEEIVFNYSKSSNNYDKVSEFLLQDIIDKELSLSKGKDYLKYMYKAADEGAEDFTKYAPCRKGCSHCCHIYMDCTAIEAELIREYVINNFDGDKINELKNKINATIMEVPSFKEIKERKEEVVELFSEKNIPCIFLDEEGGCSIYEVRPLNCRKFITFSSSTYCEKKEEVVKPNIAINNIVQYSINHLSMSVTRFKRLKAFSEDYLEERAIYKALQHWFKDGFNDINREA